VTGIEESLEIDGHCTSREALASAAPTAPGRWNTGRLRPGMPPFTSRAAEAARRIAAGATENPIRPLADAIATSM
jgi:hypothetical protein